VKDEKTSALARHKSAVGANKTMCNTVALF